MSNDLTISNVGGNLLNKINDNKIQLPFANDIYLYTLPIAGIKHYIKNDIVLINGDNLIFKREPNNKFDKYAIEVFDKDKNKLGYIPRSNNKVFARLMDGGKILMGEVKEVETSFDEINNIFIRIYMKDI